jgi:hypothetical protein
MQTHPSLSRTYSLLASPRARQFLIPPYERFKFVLLFAILTAIGELVGGYLGTSFRNLIFPPEALFPQSLINTFIPGGGLGGAFVQFTLFGTILGVAQWLVLRKYIPTWQWIGATIVGWVTIALLGEAFILAIKNLSSDPTVSPVLATISNLALWSEPWALWLLNILGSIPLIGVGIAQWFVLRQYVRAAKWWIFVPSASLICWSLYAFAIGFLLFWLPESTRFTPYSHAMVRGAILGTVQAIALCAFSRKLPSTTASDRHELQSPLTSAPEITNWQQIKLLSRQLYQQINQAWKGEIGANQISEVKPTQELIYLVGVAETGAILTYQPVNQAAYDYQHQTPLPELVSSSSHEREEAVDRTPLARFQIIFTPVGSLQIRDWGGKTLLAIALSTAAIVTVAGIAMKYVESNAPESWFPIQSDRGFSP